MIKWVNTMFAGLLCGLIAPAASLYIYCRVSFPLMTFADELRSFDGRHVLSNVLSLSVLANLLVFFIFIGFNKERSARGVLGATILYGLLIVFLKFR